MSETSKYGQYLPDHVHVILISDNDSDDESSVQSVILINEPANRDGPAVIRKIIEIIDLVDSEDDSCDDDSVSMQSVFSKEPCSFNLVDGRFSMETDETAMEFMNTGLWIAGQEKFEMADAKGIYRRYPHTLLGLSTEQVEMCRRDTEYYYNKYAETIFVKELQEMIAPGMPGFQEIRQRTAGRYDMQIPTLNTEKFFFLHDPNASWMPLVRKFLSNPNCALIHMGVILAMGKSERQKYHIDGVHLHPTKHMPCYAVNVFFYLVDIHKKNGGTEFYVGSHKFCEEDKDIGRVSRIRFECEFRQAEHALLTKVSLNVLGRPTTSQSRSTNHLRLPPRVSKL